MCVCGVPFHMEETKQNRKKKKHKQKMYKVLAK